ncbi:MAG TPA: twin-arginine translocase subunit TatC [Thermomicrobiales bacterium]|nr:twin-arginine translocase subunit TatC [Thermomicrobiales bacterium]
MARMIKVPAWKLQIPRLPKYDPNEPDIFEEMTLQEHLTELANRIKKMVYGIVLGFIVGAILVNPILDQIREAAQVEQGLDIRSPSDPVIIFFRVALYVAVGITLPNIIYQLVAFLAPGLTGKEKRVLFSSLPFMSLLFVGGVAYAYFFAIPRALDFLSTFLGDQLAWEIDAQETLSFYLALMMGLGIAFQLPVIMFVLAKIGIVTPANMRKWRKFAFLGIVVAAAIITPTTDPINLGLVVMPLMILYEAGIIVSMVFAKTSLRSAADESNEVAELARPIPAKARTTSKAKMQSETPDDV